MENSIIGGEFDIDLRNLQYIKSDNGFMEGVYKYSSGRSALYFIFLDIQKRYGIATVYLPDYLCSSIVIAAEKSGMSVLFYPLNNQFEIDLDKLPMRNGEKAAILLVNYFGLKNLSKQISVVHGVSKNAVVIEDDVQAFYEFCKSDLTADYKFTSLRKTFACPDGGIVKTDKELVEVSNSNKFHQYKLAGSILKSLRKPEYYDDDVYLHLFEKGELQIDDEIGTGMSEMSQEIIKKVDFQHVADIRQRNARRIFDGLKTLGVDTILPISDDCIPLFVPIWLDDRNKVRRQMFQNNVFCPVHWPLKDMDIKKGAEMAEHEMSIIIDQRYTNEEMDFILTILEKALK